MSKIPFFDEIYHLVHPYQQDDESIPETTARLIRERNYAVLAMVVGSVVAFFLALYVARR